MLKKHTHYTHFYCVNKYLFWMRLIMIKCLTATNIYICINMSQNIIRFSNTESRTQSNKWEKNVYLSCICWGKLSIFMQKYIQFQRFHKLSSSTSTVCIYIYIYIYIYIVALTWLLSFIALCSYPFFDVFIIIIIYLFSQGGQTLVNNMEREWANSIIMTNGATGES